MATMSSIAMICSRLRWRGPLRAVRRRCDSRDVLVIGDTVLDVACARAAGARSIAVATGPSGIDALQAAGADVVVEDLSDTAGFLRLLGTDLKYDDMSEKCADEAD